MQTEGLKVDAPLSPTTRISHIFSKSFGYSFRQIRHERSVELRFEIRLQRHATLTVSSLRAAPHSRTSTRFACNIHADSCVASGRFFLMKERSCWVRYARTPWRRDCSPVVSAARALLAAVRHVGIHRFDLLRIVAAVRHTSVIALQKRAARGRAALVRQRVWKVRRVSTGQGGFRGPDGAGAVRGHWREGTHYCLCSENS